MADKKLVTLMIILVMLDFSRDMLMRKVYGKQYATHILYGHHWIAYLWREVTGENEEARKYPAYYRLMTRKRMDQ